MDVEDPFEKRQRSVKKDKTNKNNKDNKHKKDSDGKDSNNKKKKKKHNKDKKHRHKQNGAESAGQSLSVEKASAELVLSPAAVECSDTFLALLQYIARELPEGSSARRNALARVAQYIGGRVHTDELNHFVREVQLSVLPKHTITCASTFGSDSYGMVAATGQDMRHLLPILAFGDKPLVERAETAKVNALLSSMQDKHPVMCAGCIDESNLQWFIAELLVSVEVVGDWRIVWQRLNFASLPEQEYDRASIVFARLMLEHTVNNPSCMDVAVAAFADLSRSHRLKLKNVEESIRCLVAEPGYALQSSPEVCQLLSRLLAEWFPQPRGASWGWSRVGWSFGEWWKLVHRILGGVAVPCMLGILQPTLGLLEACEYASEEVLQPLRDELAPFIQSEEMQAGLAGVGAQMSPVVVPDSPEEDYMDRRVPPTIEIDPIDVDLL